MTIVKKIKKNERRKTITNQTRKKKTPRKKIYDRIPCHHHHLHHHLHLTISKVAPSQDLPPGGTKHHLY